MRIGAFASLFAPATGPALVGDLAGRLDDAALDSLWFGEHVLLFDEMEFPYPGSADGRLPVPDGQGIPDQAPLIGFLAAHTKTLRFGTGVSLIPQRNPIYTAKEFATLDWLTGGRVDLGVGVGWCKEELLACGYAWEDRGARCDEALALLRSLWTEPVTNFDGRFFSVEGARFDPKPQQKPHVPLVIGGYSDAALRRTARFGQGWLGFGLTPELTEGMLARLDSALADAGRSRDDLEILMMPGAESDSDLEAFQALGVDRLLPMVDLSAPEQMPARVEQLQGYQARFG